MPYFFLNASRKLVKEPKPDEKQLSATEKPLDKSVRAYPSLYLVSISIYDFPVARLNSLLK